MKGLSNEAEKPRPVEICRSCIFYKVTWDMAAPYGCQLFRFKSKNLPCIVVTKNSGQTCQGYKARRPH